MLRSPGQYYDVGVLCIISLYRISALSCHYRYGRALHHGFGTWLCGLHQTIMDAGLEELDLQGDEEAKDGEDDSAS